MPYERDSDVRVKPTGRAFTAALGTLDGALYTADWVQRQIIKGNGFAASMGQLSAAETLQAVIITTRRPSMWLRVPVGTTILPFYTSVTFEDTAATNNAEVSLGVVGLDPGDGTSSAITNGPSNLNTGSGNGSLVVPRQDATGDNVASSDITADLWRIVKNEDNVATPATAGPTLYEWEPKGRMPVIVGPGALSLSIGAIAGAAAVIAYASMQWIELTGEDLPLL